MTESASASGARPGAPPDLSGRTAVVTGAGRGIGRTVALALGKAGAFVFMAARGGEAVEGVARELDDAGGTGQPTVCDVTDPGSVDALAREVREERDGADVLVNNAGASTSAPLGRTTLEEWNRLLAVNATGTFLCTRAFLPKMIERGWGRVVNVASVAGLEGGRYIAAYAAAKHAQVGFTRSAALEAAASGVTVNAVCPGFVDTPMTGESVRRIVEATGRSEDEALRALRNESPQSRLVRPEEVAHAVLFLCHDGAAAVNGETVVVDGGGRAG